MIKAGNNLPDGAVMVMENAAPKKISVSELLGDKKSIIFGVPGAFTPSCQAKHLPGFASEYENFTKLGIDLIGCIAVNDIFVMDNWSKNTDPEKKIKMLADGNADYIKKMGLEWDASEFGLGASVWSNDITQQEFFIQHIEAGMLAINKMMVSTYDRPFGGIKQSGYGQELALEGLLSFVNKKQLFRQCRVRVYVK